MKKTLVLILAVVVCSLWMHSLSLGQTAFTIPIYVTNGTDTDTLWFGVSPSATYGIDSSLGEREYPPPGVDGVFDARFLDPRTTSNSLGSGVFKDFRKLTSDCQIDTFEISFQPSTEGGNNVTFSWGTLPNYCNPSRWRLTNSLGGSPAVDVNMNTQSSVTVNAATYNHVYIRKSDGTMYRTFASSFLALDGVTAKGKTTYGAIVKPANSYSQFCVSFVNNEATAANDLHIEFKAAVDSTRLSVTKFTTWALVKAGKYDKWNFSTGTVAHGDSVVICGYSVGGKPEAVSAWWWTKDGQILGAKQKSANFSSNVPRLPMPNSVNAGYEAFKQAYTTKGDGLTVGVANTVKNGPPYVFCKDYKTVLGTLVANPGKVGKQVLQNANPSTLNKFDKAAPGDRLGKAILSIQKGLAPNKHQNSLLGEALTLKMNLLFSATAKTPAGLGVLTVGTAGAFYGETLDTLFAQASQFLTYGAVGAHPAVTATDLVTLLSQVNGAFTGALDTSSWGGTKVVFKGAKAIGDLGGLLVRVPGVEPRIISDLSASYSNTPEQYSLKQNFPNPFNPTTTIEFALPNDGYVTVKVFNLLGQEVATLVNNQLYTHGTNNIVFDASNLSSGVYFYRINVNDVAGQAAFQDLKKMVLLK